MRHSWLGLILCAALTLGVTACDDGDECSSDEARCEGVCVNHDTDANNCGSCGTVCGVGESCIDGDCGIACPDGQTECSGACVDTDSDPANCGDCGRTCEDGEVCGDGECGVTCPGSQTACEGGCFDLETSRLHCGDCETACTDGDVCVAGECAGNCSDGMTLCGGACVDTNRDRENCGDCGTDCATAEACLDGTCTEVCGPGQTDCSGDCYDLETDRLHCGDCDTACVAGQICVAGDCEISCGTATPDLCGDACVDTDTDPRYCGDCDTTCDPGYACEAGACVGACSSPRTECGGSCVDTRSNSNHCGACDVGCPDDTGADPACVGGTCRLVCDATHGDCNDDLGFPGGNGCETDVSDDVRNCGACDRECMADHGAVACVDSACEVTSCDTGYADCNLDGIDGCEIDTMSDSLHCGDCAIACADTEGCSAGVCVPVVAEHCTSAVAITAGVNTIDWEAFTADYLTASPSCTTYALSGPDVVLSYTAAVDGGVSITMDKPTSQRYVMVVSSAACGTITEVACVSEFSYTTMTTSFTATAGSTYYVYIRDTTSGTSLLPDPLVITVEDCATPDTSLVGVDPLDGSTSTTLWPVFTATFGSAVSTTAGTVTITGDAGTSLSYSVATAPEISFTTSDTVMEIDPGIAFPPGENLTISWSGIVNAMCSVPIPPPTWTLSIIAPPCSPGADGIVGSTGTRVPAGPAIISEYYIIPDQDPDGYVYVGGTSDLFRQPKAGGAVENVESLAGLTTSHMGYNMVIDGDDIYTIESTTSATAGRVFRISTDGGATWLVEDYASFSPTPGDDFKGAAVYGGRLYLATDESSATSTTEIWSVATGSSALPEAGVLETSFTGEYYCNGLAVDDDNFYLACGGNERVIRVDRATGAVTLIIEDLADLSSTVNQVYAHDTDADGSADAIYFHGWEGITYYVCDPGGSPYAALHHNYGGGTGDYGMGFDPVAARLWVYDDAADELIFIE